MLTFELDSAHSYNRTLRIHGGDPRNVFADLGLRLVRRYFKRTGAAPMADVELRTVLLRVWDAAARHGFPSPLAEKEQGQPGEVAPEVTAALTRQVFATPQGPRQAAALGEPVRQLLATLLLPEFKKCRLSYKESDAAGRVARQASEVACTHLSGSHCADCPYWVELTPEQNEKLLLKAWAGDEEVLRGDLDLFLPEEFRALRRFLHMHRRFGR